MAFLTPPTWLENSSLHNAQDYRTMLASLLGGASGVASATALAVTEKSGTANMSVDVAAGGAFVAGTRADDQGAYHAYNDDTVNVSISAADATNPRIDRVLVQIRDGAQDVGLTQNDARIFVEEGTPAASPTAPTISVADYIELAQVTVPASATSITDSDITDVRTVVRQPQLVKFTASGSFTKADYPGLRGVHVRVAGAGGGGGSVFGGSNHGHGGGGGAGGYAEIVIDASDLASSETVTIGSGGAGGGAGAVNNGSSGGASSFGSHAAANGGSGGTGGARTSGDSQVAGGAGGSATAGTVQIAGTAGGYGVVISGIGTMTCSGGSNLLSGRATPIDRNTTGVSGSGFGGGGGGATSTASNVAGGAGASGAVLVELIF